MKKITLSLFFLTQLFVFSAYATDPEDPYNKSYLLNPQDHLYTVNIDPSNPPNSLASLTETLLNLSEGGVIVHWDRETDKPADITAEIPLDTQDPLDSLLSFLHSVKTIYGINDVTEDLELQSHSTNVERDRFGIFPAIDVIVLKQVCRFSGNQIIEVDGGRIIATLRRDTKHLTRLVSSFRSIECISPTHLLTQSQLEEIYGTPNSEVLLKLAPPRPELGHTTPLYIYQFVDRNNVFHEVKATNGDIIRTHETTLGAFGLNRRVYGQTESALFCEDSDINANSNSSPQGSSCTDAYLGAYNTLNYALLPLRGKHELSQRLGGNWGWGKRDKFDLDLYYKLGQNTSENPLASPFGYFNDTGVHLQQFAQTGSFVTRQTYNGQPLPGLGEVVDLVGHEVGHGYIASYLDSRPYPTRTHTFLSPGFYEIGHAITEAFADAYGKLAEAEARFAHAQCSEGMIAYSCGNQESVPCHHPEHSPKYCSRGEYCAFYTCFPCVDDCVNQTTLATLDPKFVHTYHKTDYPVLQGTSPHNSFFRDLTSATWNIQISCQTTPSNYTQRYENGLFLSRMLFGYLNAYDDFQQRNNYIRHRGDLAVAIELFTSTLVNLRDADAGPSRRDAEIAFIGGMGSATKDIPNALWNQTNPFALMTTVVMPLVVKLFAPIPGKCTSNCIADSKYECFRPQ